ncbi:MAG: carotenoid oxygenase family protein [Acidimicrobiales bacterium]|nr:carotenoid oxygenase family protein [Acidimicrobiales bacterium]
MPSPTEPSIPLPTDLDLVVRGTVPPGLSGRLVGIGRDGVVHTVHLHGARASYRAHRSPMAAAVRHLVAFGGSVLAFGEDSLVQELSARGDTISPVDLAGHGRVVAAHHHEPGTGELHLVARELHGAQAHVVVSAGALTRRSRPVLDAPGRIGGLVVTRTRVVFLAGGSVGVAWRDGEARTTWIATGAGAPHPVHAHDAGDAVVLLAITPSLERWTISCATVSVEREVLDAMPRRFAHCGREGADGTIGTVWTTGDGTVGRHDLATGSHDHHGLWPQVPGDMVLVPDLARVGDGWLVGFAHDASESASELRVIDTDDVAGPTVASVRLPQRIGRDLRCTWIPAAAHTNSPTTKEINP